jgi:hypothetical protein
VARAGEASDERVDATRALTGVDLTLTRRVIGAERNAVTLFASTPLGPARAPINSAPRQRPTT